MAQAICNAEVARRRSGLADTRQRIHAVSAGLQIQAGSTATPLARGKQGKSDFVVAWTNTYNKKTKVFATTLGHNNDTVADPRYLDLVTRGMLWSVDKLNDSYLKKSN